MMDFNYWKNQISNSKEAHKSFFKDAETCDKEYTDDKKNYNIFFSNVSILDANLRLNNPKPDIQRRFLKRIEADKKKSNLYGEVARILSGAVEYVSDISGVDDIVNRSVHNDNVEGRGIGWVEYEPTISIDATTGEEFISKRETRVYCLKYDEFLCSTAKSLDESWWVARRHLLSRNEIAERFKYKPDDSELDFKQEDETQLKRGEVWEIWDKNEKQRLFILLGDSRQEFLEVQDDPYKLEGFFPCAELCWLKKEKTNIPVAEYMVYKKKADLLEVNSKKTAEISEELKFVQLIGSQDKNITKEVVKANNGDVLSLPTNDVNGSIQGMVGVLPTDGAVALLTYLEQQKQQLKQDIYDITGISDIMRGVSDARETASAQLIKGLFGSLRFQDRQKQVQVFRRSIYRIIAEIISEHYDEKTLSEMTCTYLPHAKEIQETMIKANLNQATPEEMKFFEDNKDMPTWEEVMEILHSDHLRNYTVDVETTATAFDNQQQQMESIQNLTQMYLELTRTAMTLNSPALLKGFLPLVKMNLMSIKVSSSVAKELQEAIESAYNQMEQASKMPAQPTPEQLAIQAQQSKAQMDRQTDLDKLQVEVEKLKQDSLIREKEIALKEQEIAIKQQEADRKEAELQMQYDLKMKEIQTGVDINTNISGDVASVE